MDRWTALENADRRRGRAATAVMLTIYQQTVQSRSHVRARMHSRISTWIIESQSWLHRHKSQIAVNNNLFDPSAISGSSLLSEHTPVRPAFASRYNAKIGSIHARATHYCAARISRSSPLRCCPPLPLPPLCPPPLCCAPSAF